MAKVNSLFKGMGFASVILLSACGDKYPQIGVFNDPNISVKNLSHPAQVYSLDNDVFVQWKSTYAKLSDIDNLEEDQLLALRRDFSLSSLVTKQFASVPVLVDKAYDIDSRVNQTFNNVEGNIAKAKDNIEQYTVEVTQLDKEKSVAVNAQQKLAALKYEFVQQRKELKSSYQALKEESAVVFQRFTQKELGAKSNPSELILTGSAFDSFIKKDKDLSCKEYGISKNKWKRDSFENYLYAAPVHIADKMYCPIFKPMGNSHKKRKALIESLNDKEQGLLTRTALAKVKSIKYKKVLLIKERNVGKNNPELLKISRSFSQSNERRLNALTKAISQEKNNIKYLSQVNKVDLKNKEIDLLVKELTRARMYFLYDALHRGFKKESIIQPDGVFKLDSESEFFLVAMNLSNSARPELEKYAVIRMAQYKNKEEVSLSASEFLTLNDLTRISL